MERKIRVFKNFEEQEQYHLEQMRRSTVHERLRQLYAMQQMTQLLHPNTDRTRKLVISKWTF